MKAIIILLLVSQTLFSQSLENLQGQYSCEADGFLHLYEFKNRRLKATLNFKDLFVVKHTIFYTFLKTKSKDSILVIKSKHEMERLDPLNLKDDKSSYSPYTSNNREKNCCHLWVLEKSEDEKLFIKIIPFRDNLFKRIYKSDSNLISHVILTPIID